MRLSARAKNIFDDPRKVMTIAAGLGVFFVFFYAFFNITVPHDVANCYAYMAREFSRGNWARAFYPGLPPLQTTLGGILCYFGVEAFPAMELVSGAFFVATIFPLYGFLKRYLAGKHAAWGALIYILNPSLIRYGCSGMPGSARNFFVMLAIYLIFRFLDNSDKMRYLWGVGFAFAGLSMSRGEGMALAIFLGIATIFMLWRKSEFSFSWHWLKKICHTLFWLIAASVIFLSPRLYQNYMKVGYAIPDYRVAMALHERLSALDDDEAKENVDRDQKGTTQLSEASERLIATEPAVEKEISGSLVQVLIDTLNGCYWFYLLLAIIGAAYLLNRKKWDIEYNLLLLLVIFNSGLFYFVVSSPRYYTVNVPLLAVFIVNGLLMIGEFLADKKKLSIMFGILFLLLAVNQIWSALAPAVNRDFLYQKEAGEWIEANRKLFNSTGERLKMYQSTQSQICFWSDSDPVHKDLGPMLNPATFKEFDVAIFSPQDKTWLEIMRSRPDVEEISGPYDKQVVIFRKKVRNQNETLSPDGGGAKNE